MGQLFSRPHGLEISFISGGDSDRLLKKSIISVVLYPPNFIMQPFLPDSRSSSPTRFKLFNSRGAHFLPVRTFNPTRFKLFNSRGVHFLPVRRFNPTRLRLFNSCGAHFLPVRNFDTTRLKLFNSRGVHFLPVRNFAPHDLKISSFSVGCSARHLLSRPHQI